MKKIWKRRERIEKERVRGYELKKLFFKISWNRYFMFIMFMYR
jgi:hypothetical protein